MRYDNLRLTHSFQNVMMQILKTDINGDVLYLGHPRFWVERSAAYGH